MNQIQTKPIILFIFICFAVAGLSSTATAEKQHKNLLFTSNQPQGTEQSLVYLEHSDALIFDKKRLENIQILQGNVCFRHDEIFMYCDSAYFYEKENSLDAFGHVKIVQGDTLFVYGDKLYYDGNTRMARLRHNVKMENRNSVLTTDSLNYNRIANVGYYFNGGKLKDDVNELTSYYGYYYPDTRKAAFRKHVKLINPKFNIQSDTLNYNTNTGIADIVGPTNIVYEKETNIYSEKGWYDTKKENSMLLDNSYIEHQNTKRFLGDTILYSKPTGIGFAYRNIELTDTLKKISLFGQFGYYNEKTEEGLVTDSAMMLEYSGSDSLFLHADTLFTFPDSIYSKVIAYHNVRFYRYDIQGITDSMYYSTRDSVLNMIDDPIVWSGQQQILGDTIRAYTANGTIEKIHVKNSAFACQRKDSIHYNQISGKELWAFIRDSTLYKVEVNGNAESIFFPIDEADNQFIGLNRTASSYLNAYFKNGKIQRIVLLPRPTGKLYPMKQIPEDQLYFPSFVWYDKYRPHKKEDIFLDLKRPLKKNDPLKEKKRSRKKNIKE